MTWAADHRAVSTPTAIQLWATTGNTLHQQESKAAAHFTRDMLASLILYRKVKLKQRDSLVVSRPVAHIYAETHCPKNNIACKSSTQAVERMLINGFRTKWGLREGRL
eukprot:scpid110272/ scgid35087/ 